MSLPRLTSVGQLPEVKLDHRDLDVPEWGVSVLVWELTAKDRVAWETGGITTRGGRVTKLDVKSSTARLLHMALRDDAGHRQFSMADIDRLMEQGGGAVARIERVARELSGLDLPDEDDDSDETGGGSGNHPGAVSIPPSGSSTISPLP